MLDCLHPDCDEKFDSKQGRNTHFASHNDCEDIALKLLSDTEDIKCNNCSEKVGLSSAFYESRFGSWNDALQLAGKEVNQEKDISDEELLEEIERMSEDGQVRYDEMNEDGKYSARVYEVRFGSWNDALNEAGLDSWDRTGEENPCWRGGVTSYLYSCKYCCNFFTDYKEYDRTFCSHDCKSLWQSENWVGEDSYTWKGGHETYRGSSWESAKQSALSRADHICEHPDCSKGTNEIGRNVDIHHIVPYKYFDSHKEANKLSNLIALCPSHHHQEEARIWRIESVGRNS